MKFKEGDRAIVIANITGHDFNKGDTVTITELYPYEKPPNYRCDNGREHWYLTDDELLLLKEGTLNVWVSTENRPLYRETESGWVCTEDGEGEFIAAVPIMNNNVPGWWIRHCIIEDGVGLCLVTDDVPETAGYDMGDVTHFMKLNNPI